MLLRCRSIILLCILCVAANAAAVIKTSEKRSALDGQDFSSTGLATVVYPNSPEFSLKLKSNPTTGYSWYLLHYDESLVEPMSHRYYAPQSSKGSVGSAGYEVWVFRVKPKAFVVPNMLSIAMSYARPFDVKALSVRQYHIVTASRDSRN
jgi:predicted secreted protein